MTQLSSALFIDFDNIFLGLFGLDRTAAFAFAESPDLWVEALRLTRAPDGADRRFLVRRAYVNPNGWVSDEQRGNESGRVYLSRFRPELVRAGFEVVDCPALTSRTKNAADIRIVIDVMKLLDRPVRYDEIVVASGDADFTPLLHEIRAADRRVVVIAARGVAPAYRAVADVFVDDEGLIALTAGPPIPSADSTDGDGAAAAHLGVSAPADRGGAADLAAVEAARATVEMLVRAAMNDSAAPVNLAQLGNAIYAKVDRRVLSGSNWLGAGGLQAFVVSLDSTWETNQHHAWDPARHSAPAVRESAGPGSALPQAVAAFQRYGDLPSFPSAVWPRVFALLAVYSHAHHDSANIGEASAYVRDQMTETGTPVGRAAVGTVIRHATYGGAPLSSPQNPESLLNGLVANVEDRMEAAGRPVSADDVAALRSWLNGEDASEAAAAAS